MKGESIVVSHVVRRRFGSFMVLRRRAFLAWLSLVLTLVGGLSAELAAKQITVATALLGPNRGHPYQAITMPAVMPLLAVYDTLTVVNNDGTVGPGLAVSWESEDAVTWRFTLREGVTFSNGVPFTSDAVVRSVKHMRETADAGTWTISTRL
jgi:peptide/nickel transport system substrate-binding protein